MDRQEEIQAMRAFEEAGLVYRCEPGESYYGDDGLTPQKMRAAWAKRRAFKARKRQRKPRVYQRKPRPVCALDGCENECSRPTTMHCCKEHALLNRAKSSMKTLKCGSCGKEFERQACKIRSEKVYCSHECQYEGMRR